MVLSSEGTLASESRAVVVPTRGAGRQAARIFPSDAPLPAFLTRDELYDDLNLRLTRPPGCLSAFERDAVAQAAAAHAAEAVSSLSFQLRPGLVSEILRFYDQLRRQSQLVKRFEELIEDALGDTASDRGAERMLRQTRFLAAAFREYEHRVLSTGACDEHLLRERLMKEPARNPLRHVVVTVADWIADPAGLFVADFDLLAGVPGLELIDMVCTEAVLGSGFHERIHLWWPGLEEVEAADLIARIPAVRPLLSTPADTTPDQPWFTYRDREEELVAVARLLKGDRESAVVFKRPLPYLYLAPDTFGAAGIPYQAYDALPLAAEPTAAALDVVLEFVETNFSRDAVVALLETPHLQFAHRHDIPRQAVTTLNRALSAHRYLGDLARLEALAVDGLPLESQDGLPALEATLTAARALSPLLEPSPASQQIRRLRSFIVGHLSVSGGADLFGAREGRARATILDLLASLAAAHETYHDPLWTIEDLAAGIRRWIGEETFVPESARTGVHLVDDQAARYGDFDDMTLVGLVDSEWPERPRRSIFYPPSLLKALGWPSEKDRRSAEDARFVDLVRSPSREVRLSTFLLDDETLATRSTLLDDIARIHLSSRVTEDRDARGDPDEDALAGATRAWVDMRFDRSPADAAQFHGNIGPQAPQAWSVSALETYLNCPFKFFAQHVLRLQEEPDDEEVMDPRRQGQLVHTVFEAFFKEWQATGHGAITPQSLIEARGMFAEVVERSLTGLSDAEAGLERTRLLGSPAAAGLGEAVFRMEAERPTPVVERLLEHPLKGTFTIATASGPRAVSLRGKADRMDLLADGTFRLIDYKLGWPPDRAKALQLPIYGICAERTLDNRHGRRWTLGEAAYLAFKGPKRVVPLFSTPSGRDDVLAKAQQRLADTLDRIERGEFPPAPDDVFRCETCSFASVCRKDYVGG